MERVCSSTSVAEILWRSLSEDDQLVSKKLLEGILTIKGLVESTDEAGIAVRFRHDEEEIKNVCYTIVGAMLEMGGH